MLVDVLTPLAISLSAVVAVSGLAKLRDPAEPAALLASVRISGGRRLVMVLGAAEVATGVIGIAAPSRVSGSCLAAAYLAFGLFSAYALRAGASGANCGCFGVNGAPLTRAHLAANIAAGIGALACVAAGAPHGLRWLAQQGVGVAAIALVASVVATIAWFAVFTLLPHAWTAWSPEEAR
jgi:hypothetical protein